MRPHYETEADLTREQMVMERIAKARPSITAYHKVKNPSYGVDFWVESSSGCYVIEIKCRKGKYDSWRVALSKVLKARVWEDSGFPAILCVHWDGDDSIYTARPFGDNPTPYTAEWNGRTKKTRGDECDMEPHATFKLGAMRKL